jgi:nucleoid-associated protein YgaU
MNTKVKLGIAGAIVAALVALIVLDQKTASNPESKPAAAPGDGNVVVGPPPVSRPGGDAFKIRDEGIERIRRAAEDNVGATPPPEDNKVKKGNDLVPGKEVKPAGEEYVVVEGDSFEKIARKKLGDGKWASLVQEANPTVKATALRPGQKLVIPAKPEPRSETKIDLAKSDASKTEEAKKPDPKLSTVFQTGPHGERFYTVQAGDTLSGISVKVYNTSRYVEKIHDANKERLEDPSMLYVGMKLVMPDLPKKETAGTGTGVQKTSAPDTTGKKTYTVQPGENLWKIASKIAGDKGIEETMRVIVSLNPEKLKGIGDAIRSGWQLIMPE